MQENPDMAYDLLNEEYRNKRFGSVEEFKNYIHNNQEEIKGYLAREYEANQIVYMYGSISALLYF